MAVATMTPIHEDQRIRRRRARISQEELGRFLGCSKSKISEYEKAGKPLPWSFTPDDYDDALTRAIEARKGNEKGEK